MPKQTVPEYFSEKKQDYYRLKELLGYDVYDYCGAWCNNDMMTKLLNAPNKKVAGDMFSSLITRYYDVGYDFNDRRYRIEPHAQPREVQEIFVRNGNLSATILEDEDDSSKPIL